MWRERTETIHRGQESSQLTVGSFQLTVGSRQLSAFSFGSGWNGLDLGSSLRVLWSHYSTGWQLILG